MRIADGRTSFYQWDHDQMLTVPEDCTEVHFDNGTQPNALCCAVKEDGMVDVPNILLQTAAQIHAYGWNKERKCVVRYVCLWVEPREKPDDYVYTQTDVLRIETEIANQLQALKDSGELTGPQGPAGPKGDPGPAEVFIAEYGKTSFAEMDEARAAGKLLFLHTGNNIVPMYDHIAGSSVSFYRITSSQVINYYRTAKGNWSNKTINLCDERITGIESNLGDIESALDTIIAIQEELINNGGGSGEDEGSYCPNCGEFTGEGPCPNNCYELEKTFYVDGEYYTYYSGMTWEDFINSGYNKTVTCSDCGSKNKLAYTDGDSVYFLIGACCGIGHVTLYYDENHEIPVHLTAGIVGEHSYYF